ncbi:MAG TPA: hypothetical protein VL284_04660 [Thermoanaerobaculia bacterium]|nr:hypothetical protein [Thermoanaerobaculia bacterium]
MHVRCAHLPEAAGIRFAAMIFTMPSAPTICLSFGSLAQSVSEGEAGVCGEVIDEAPKISQRRMSAQSRPRHTRRDAKRVRYHRHDEVGPSWCFGSS